MTTASNVRSWRQRAIRALLAVIAAVLVGGLALYLVGRLLFPIKVVHTRDLSTIEARLKMKMVGVSSAEGYFVHGFRVWQCWARFQIPRENLDGLLRVNRMLDKVQPPWGTAERVRRSYANPGFGGERTADWEDWVAKDFVPEGEYKQFASSIVFGGRKGSPDVVSAYVNGCPRDSNVVMPAERP